MAGVLLATQARAQSNAGAIVTGSAGVVAIDSHTDLMVSGYAGYRFNQVFGLGIELTSVPELSRESIVYPYIRFDADNAEGRATIFTTNVRLEVPTTSPRVIPYAVAGGGVANVEESVDAILVLGVSASATPPIPSPAIFPPPTFQRFFLYSTTDLALTVGGGVSIRAGGHLSIDVDLRYLRLLGDEDRNVGRFGSGVSYRF